MNKRTLVALLLGSVAMPCPHVACGADEPAPGAEAAVELSPLVRRVLSDPLNSRQVHVELSIFHGQWEALRPEDLDVAQRAAVALGRFDLTHPSLSDEAAPPLLRAEAALLRGEPELANTLLADDAGAQAAVLRGRALEDLGRYAEAVKTLEPWRRHLSAQTIDDPARLVAAAQALVMLANLEGRPSQDYHLALTLFTKAHDELDRLFWPALLAEAQLLAAKDNRPEAVKAAAQVLSLNPSAGWAWWQLGQIAASGFDFTRAAKCVTELRKINPDHLLADLLEAESALMQKTPRAAEAVLQHTLARYPRQRQALALLAAAHAMAHRQADLNQTLRRFDELSPRSPLALYTAGRMLSLSRQYRASEDLLRRAIALQPNWPDPRVELGLMLMQAGDEESARAELEAAVSLDPFHRRAGNQLKLAEHLATYHALHTEHFTIKYKPGLDEVLALDMRDQLEAMYREVTDAFGHKPANRTLIEIMPDEKWFGVRITGLPEIWTIAAATGDVIALTPPREGPGQRGSFDWARVIRHEFTHTVTLDQTRNRIAHWFTEAAAVAMEPGDRDYETCRLLAHALRHDQLFTLENITWGFVRPTTPADRPLAYAQAHWMYQFITQRFGHSAIHRLLDLYAQGVEDPDAVEQAVGMDQRQFMEQFKTWAKREVDRWGLGEQPEDAELADALSHGATVSDAKVSALLERFPNHPDLLQLAAARAVKAGDADAALALLARYAQARPVDPWADEQLAALALRSDRPRQAVAALEQLDRQESKSGAWAIQLAKLYRSAEQLDAAAASVTRALHREPYNATYRELAAAVALQRRDDDAALRYLRDLTILEPDRAIHFVRLAALYARMEKADEARAAAEQARRIDPDAPVERFLP